MVREPSHVGVPVGLGSARSRRKVAATAETRNESWRATTTAKARAELSRSAAVTAIARVVLRRTTATTKAGHEVGEGSRRTATASERRYDRTLSRVRNEVVGAGVEVRAGSRAWLRSWGLRSSFRSR